MFNFLVGRKSYVIAALTATLTFLKMTGHINDDLYQSLLALLGAGAVASVRAAISKV